jgi:elongation factor Tu
MVLPESAQMAMPVDSISATVELISPLALEQGARFTIREEKRTVGTGMISELLD